MNDGGWRMDNGLVMDGRMEVCRTFSTWGKALEIHLERDEAS